MRTLTAHWRITPAILLVLGLILALTLGMSLTSDKSDATLAQEIVSESPEVLDALGSEEIRILEIDVIDGKAVVICGDKTGNSYVVVELDLDNKEVIRINYPAVGEPYLPNPEMKGATLQTTTNKMSYEPGEEVIINITNISPGAISGGGVYFAVYNLDGNLLAGDGFFLAFDWELGEIFASLTWNQMNDQGEQVAPGTYVMLGKAGDYSDATLFSIR